MLQIYSFMYTKCLLIHTIHHVRIVYHRIEVEILYKSFMSTLNKYSIPLNKRRDVCKVSYSHPFQFKIKFIHIRTSKRKDPFDTTFYTNPDSYWPYSIKRGMSFPLSPISIPVVSTSYRQKKSTRGEQTEDEIQYFEFQVNLYPLKLFH